MKALFLGRWKFTIAALIVAVVGTLIYQFWYRRAPEGCAPVIELLDFNQRQSQVIDEKYGGDEARVPSPAELAAYTAWADGLADRAGRVTAPNLAAPAVGLATSANDFVGKLKEISATPHAPGAPAPPAVYQLSILNDQITDDIAELTKACRR